MSLGEITDEIRQVYEAAIDQLQTPHWSVQFYYLAIALREQVGARLKAEFWQEHDEVYGRGEINCKRCGTKNFDPRHNFTNERWLREAGQVLTEGEL